LADLLQALDREQFEPGVFVFQPSAHPLPNDLDFPLKLVPPGKVFRRIGLLQNLTASLRHFRPDIVQIFFRDASFFGPIASRIARVPVVVISRRDMQDPRWWERPVIHFMSKLVDAWSCNSRAVAEWLDRNGWVKLPQIAVIPNSIDLDWFRPPNSEERRSARESLQIPGDVPVFISIANYRPVKGLPTIIEAASLLRDRIPGAKYFLIGDGPERRNVIDEINRHGVADIVNLAGAKSDVRPWLHAADIGLLASYREGSSNTVIEYMASGLPAVTSDIVSNRELGGGTLFAVGNAQDLAEKILELWSQPSLREQVSRRSRELAMSYSYDAFAKRATDFYLQLAKKLH
jgi:glycosyltransferase involved in cell wall biosynthesis